jgi:hypothetical protein
LKMLGVAPEIVGIIGAGLLILGPVAWGFIRMSRGLPPYENFNVPGAPAPRESREPEEQRRL